MNFSVIGPSHAELDERFKEWRPSGLSDDELREYLKDHRVK